MKDILDTPGPRASSKGRDVMDGQSIPLESDDDSGRVAKIAGPTFTC